MLRSEVKKDVLDFIKKYPNPDLMAASTMIDGYVTCIKPIPTICGAELMCNPKDMDELRQLVAGGA